MERKKNVQLALLICVLIASLLFMSACSSMSQEQNSQQTESRAATQETTGTQEQETAATTKPDQQQPSDTPDESSTDGKYTFGLSFSDVAGEFGQGLSMAAQEAVANAGSKSVFVVADKDATKQSQQISDLLTQNVDAVLCFAADTEAILSSAEEAFNAGVPFIQCSRISTDLTHVSLALGFDNYQSAALDGQAMLDAAEELGYGQVKCIELIGNIADQNAVERQEGFERFCEENGIEIVAEVLTEWNTEVCYSRLVDTIQNLDSPDAFNAIYCPSDTLLPPIMSAFNEFNCWTTFGTDNYKIITSIDGGPAAIEMIKAGYVYSTASNDPLVLGRTAVEMVIDMLDNGTSYVGDGKKIWVPAQSITKVIADTDDTIWGNRF